MCDYVLQTQAIKLSSSSQQEIRHEGIRLLREHLIWTVFYFMKEAQGRYASVPRNSANTSSNNAINLEVREKYVKI